MLGLKNIRVLTILHYSDWVGTATSRALIMNVFGLQTTIYSTGLQVYSFTSALNVWFCRSTTTSSPILSPCPVLGIWLRFFFLCRIIVLQAELLSKSEPVRFFSVDFISNFLAKLHNFSKAMLQYFWRLP